MKQEIAISHALNALSFIIADENLQERFFALSGISPEEMRSRLQEVDFLASILEFLVSHDPDLISYAESANEKPEHIVTAWRALGGGVGQEW